MDKRKEANLRVKTAITDTLFDLMSEKNLHDISITELIQKAGVARVSFYRNYSSKEDVLVSLVKDVLDDFRENADYDMSNPYTLHHIKRTFEYFLKYKRYMINLYHSGFGSMVLEELNNFHRSIMPEPKTNSERYHLYMYMGSLYNTVIYWLQEENPVDIEEIAQTILDSNK